MKGMTSSWTRRIIHLICSWSFTCLSTRYHFSVYKKDHVAGMISYGGIGMASDILEEVINVKILVFR